MPAPSFPPLTSLNDEMRVTGFLRAGIGLSWRLATPPFPGSGPLTPAGDLDPAALCRTVLTARGLAPEAHATFLSPPASSLGDPFLLVGMDAAVARLTRAIADGERIAVHGDCDVDGLTSAVLLAEGLRALEADILLHIPSRAEGHGLQARILDRLAGQGTSVLVTTDGGVTASDMVAYARTRGLDVIVTDHHEPLHGLPDALAIIDPLRPDCGYSAAQEAAGHGPCTLSGAGIAYKLLCALLANAEGTGHRALGVDAVRAQAIKRRALDLLGIGLVADMAPLTGETRTLARAGLRALETTPRPGIRALLQRAKSPPTITGETISFDLAPRLAAAFRLGQPDLALALLATEDEDTADDLAAQLDVLNERRKEMSRQVTAGARALVDPARRVQVLVGAGPGWGGGILGLAAGRLAEETGGPVLVLAAGLDGVAAGSARSVPGYHMQAALARCADLLSSHGGHAGAAGLALPLENVAALADRLEAMAAALPPVAPPVLEIDAVLPGTLLSRDTLAAAHEALGVMEPCGSGNPAAILAWAGVHVVSAKAMGKGREHLAVELAASTAGNTGRRGGTVRGVAFGRPDLVAAIRQGDLVTIAATSRVSPFGMRPTLELLIHDIAHDSAADGLDDA